MVKIGTILDHIDNGHMALPEFQRGYVWNRDQVRGFFDSLYRRHPVGGLLVWATGSLTADHRGTAPLAPGIVKLLLDGQQRITSIYGVVRGKPPQFFDGNPRAFTGLRFHLEEETFEFFQPIKMRDDPLWIDVSELMRDGISKIFKSIEHKEDDYLDRLTRIHSIPEVELHVEEVTGQDKSLDVVVDIFNRVNTGGTKLSKGDLALAKICADWPAGRSRMGARLDDWKSAGFHFTRDWLLRSVNTVLTGEAQFQHLHERSATDIQHGLDRAAHHIDQCLNLIGSRLGLDHDRVFFGRNAIPVMARYLDQRSSGAHASMDERERDKLLFWYVQAAMWGRFSSSTETAINQDIEALEAGQGLDGLLRQLRLWRGNLRAEATDFRLSSLGARFYPVLYLLTRMGEAMDWGTGLPLKATLLGKMSAMEVHHIFPKARLKESGRGYSRGEVNGLANFCFLTKDTNLAIRDRPPEQYFEEVNARYPDALDSQWIPRDQSLWRVDRFRDFLAARQELLAAELNRRMAELLHGDTRWLDPAQVANPSERRVRPLVLATDRDDEETALRDLNQWIEAQGLRQGELDYDFSDPDTGEQRAVLDLAWPDGIQAGLTQPVAVLLNEEREVLSMASQGGFRCFTDVADFQRHVQHDILGDHATDDAKDEPKAAEDQAGRTEVEDLDDAVQALLADANWTKEHLLNSVVEEMNLVDERGIKVTRKTRWYKDLSRRHRKTIIKKLADTFPQELVNWYYERQ